MLKKIGIGLGLLVIAFLIVVALQPAEFRIERSQRMDAPPYVVFNLLNNFHRWPAWSPWEKLDPNMQKKHAGPEFGTGASYEWTGNDEVGQGRMTITESVPAKRVVIKLEFVAPWEATNTTVFTLTPEGKAVDVTWAMEGHNNFMAKAASLFMDLDQLVGKDFERGLTTLKQVAEKEAREIARAKSEQAKAEQAKAKAKANADADADADATAAPQP